MKTWWISENSLYVWEGPILYVLLLTVHTFFVYDMEYMYFTYICVCVCTVCIFCCNVLCAVSIPQYPSKLQGVDVED